VLNAVVLNVVLLSVIMLCAGTPLKGRRISTCRSAAFHAKTIFLYKTTYLNEPSIVLASFPLVSGSMLSVMVLFYAYHNVAF
jgi:hypothetical protein